MPLSPASLMQAEIRKFWETRESSPSDYRGQRQPDEDVCEYATLRRAQLKASDHISGHFGEGYSTEIFECFNAIFHMCSVLSNHQAPSHDIALTCAELDRFKHVVSGGWWRNSHGAFVQAGAGVRRYFANAQVQRRLEYVQCNTLIAGAVHCLKKSRSNPVKFSSLNITPSASSIFLESQSEWYFCTFVISQQGERCMAKSWVFAKAADQTIIGHISSILTSAPSLNCEPGTACVILEHFILTNSVHPHFNMPELIKVTGSAIHTVVATKDIMFIVNVQHNCLDGKCTASGREARQQEHTATEVMHPVLVHTNDTHYILNLHTLHNAAVLRKVLPRHLTIPQPYLSDRLQKHKDMATALRIEQDTKRQKEADAREACKAKRQAEKATAVHFILNDQDGWSANNNKFVGADFYKNIINLFDDAEWAASTLRLWNLQVFGCVDSDTDDSDNDDGPGGNQVAAIAAQCAARQKKQAAERHYAKMHSPYSVTSDDEDTADLKRHGHLVHNDDNNNKYYGYISPHENENVGEEHSEEEDIERVQSLEA
ncbi:hypothetical protein A0H81_00232 [Grifola frondosa]|uniref:Uncharacterized protein n=1 Tax=Grifola frondosa TaxID=5627 RepID=A0A1C7MUE0_GRIFR|nr:hypothetical protein A0H81_00232 [Grifola frondosa]